MELILRIELRFLSYQDSVIGHYTISAHLFVEPGWRIELQFADYETAVLPLYEPGTETKTWRSQRELNPHFPLDRRTS